MTNDYSPPTLEGRTMADLGAQVAALRADLAAKDARIAELEAENVGLWGEPLKAVAMKWQARAEQAEAAVARLRTALERAQRELMYCGYSTSEGGVISMIHAALRATCPACHGTGTNGERRADGAPLVCGECGR